MPIAESLAVFHNVKIIGPIPIRRTVTRKKEVPPKVHDRVLLKAMRLASLFTLVGIFETRVRVQIAVVRIDVFCYAHLPMKVKVEHNREALRP
jgi:hypothetical protein